MCCYLYYRHLGSPTFSPHSILSQGFCPSIITVLLPVLPPFHYRHLGLSIFFPYPALSTIPLLVGHDNQQWRNLLGDLGPVCRWWCFEHCFLKGWVHCPFPFPFHFIFGLIYIIVNIITSYTASRHHTYTLVSAWLTHPFHLIIMLTLVCHCCLPL